MSENNYHPQLTVEDMRKVIEASLLTDHEIRDDPALQRRIQIEKELRTSSSTGLRIAKAIKDFRYDQIPLHKLIKSVGEYGDVSYFYNALFQFSRIGDPFKEQPLYNNYEIVTTEYLNDLYTGKLKAKDELRRLDPTFLNSSAQERTQIQRSVSNPLRPEPDIHNDNSTKKGTGPIVNQIPKEGMDGNFIKPTTNDSITAIVDDEIHVPEPKPQSLNNSSTDNQISLSISTHIEDSKNDHSEIPTSDKNNEHETVNHIVTPMEHDHVISQQDTLTGAILTNKEESTKKLPDLVGIKNSTSDQPIGGNSLTSKTDSSTIPPNITTQSELRPVNKNMEERISNNDVANKQHTEIPSMKNSFISNEDGSRLDQRIVETVPHDLDSGKKTEPTENTGTKGENGEGNKLTNTEEEHIIPNQQINIEAEKFDSVEETPVRSDNLVGDYNNNNRDSPSYNESTKAILPGTVAENNYHTEYQVEQNSPKLNPTLPMIPLLQTEAANKKRKAEDNLENEHKKVAVPDEHDSVLDNIKNSTMAFQSLLGGMHGVSTTHEKEHAPEVEASHSYESSNSGSRRNSYGDDGDEWSDITDDQVAVNDDDNDSEIEAGSNYESEKSVEIDRLPKALKRMNDLAKKYGLYE